MTDTSTDVSAGSATAVPDGIAGMIREEDTVRALIAMVAAFAIGEGSLISMPFVLGATVERYHLAEGVAGIITSAQFAAQGIVSIALVSRVHKVDCRRIAISAGLFILVGHLLAILAGHWPLFLVSRILAGAGEGATLSIASATAARTKNPHRTFAILTIAMLVTATFLYTGVPVLMGRFGPVSVFYVLIGLVGIAFPALLAMPDGAHLRTRPATVHANVWKPFPWILVGVAAIYIGGTVLWAYTERIGVAIGLDIDVIALAIVAGVILGALGPILADFSVRRWGNRKPIQIGLVVCVGGLLLLAFARTRLEYFAGNIVANASYLFLLPYYQALTAFQDPTGRLAVGTVTVRTSGTALAPFLGGMILIAGGGYPAIGAAAVALVVASFFLVAGVARKADSQRSATDCP